MPELIGARPKVKQMITVSSATVRLDQRHAQGLATRSAKGEWVMARGPIPVVLGYNGWVKAMKRRQSTGTTPAGRFRLPYAFGNSADPGARLPYRHVDGNDYWPYEPRDPATYNVFQAHKAVKTRWRAGYAERLASYGEQYAYALVVGFNLPSGVHYSRQRRQWVARHRADTSRGGGIFLHVRGDGLTAGCVAMNRRDMRWLVRWVRPGADARLVMGPHDYIVNL
ncbi:MAG: L,D-transpeptidase family protein [Nocardioidaceae bacterium]